MSDDTSDLAVVANEESPSLRRLDVTVAQPRVERAYDRAYRDIAKNARVKGFRPGKVPRAVLEKLYGASLGEEIERVLVNETLGAALAQAGVEPVATPSVDATPPQPRRGVPLQGARRGAAADRAAARSRACPGSGRSCWWATTRSSARSRICAAATRR